MWLFDGKFIVKHYLNRSDTGTWWVMISNETDDEHHARVIVQKYGGGVYEIYTEDMLFSHCLDKMKFLSLFEGNKFECPIQKDLSDAYQLVRDCIEMSMHRDNEHLEVSSARAKL